MTKGHPWLGYGMVAAAAILFAFNGTVSKVILTSGLTSPRLTELRVTGAVLGLILVLALIRPDALRVSARELPFLALFGIAGVALVQWLYFFAINRLEIGIALVIQYLAPLLVALWARFVLREPVRRRIWLALVLAFTGLLLVVEIWRGGALDRAGVAASLGAALTFALYILLAERGVRRRDPLSLSFYGFVFAALFWAVLQPWWSFPGDRIATDASLLGNLDDVSLPVWLLVGWVIVLGTIVPFALVVAALRHIPATRAGLIAMLEPVAGAMVAWVWLGESLGVGQVFGGAVVLSGIVLAQTAR